MAWEPGSAQDWAVTSWAKKGPNDPYASKATRISEASKHEDIWATISLSVVTGFLADHHQEPGGREKEG